MIQQKKNWGFFSQCHATVISSIKKFHNIFCESKVDKLGPLWFDRKNRLSLGKMYSNVYNACTFITLDYRIAVGLRLFVILTFS